MGQLPPSGSSAFAPVLSQGARDLYCSRICSGLNTACSFRDVEVGTSWICTTLREELSKGSWPCGYRNGIKVIQQFISLSL